ncbi:hypothetical protein K438DRAFT_1960017 [Mycena galopus ATCC 62051]|nr:hypothetical protein K438DRAFT_1960017 [Mycena galopus ATCC 62051]
MLFVSLFLALKDLRELFWYIWLRPRRTSLTGVRGDAVLRGAEREGRAVANCVEWCLTACRKRRSTWKYVPARLISRALTASWIWGPEYLHGDRLGARLTRGWGPPGGNPLRYHRTAYKYAALYRLECLLPMENIILNLYWHSSLDTPVASYNNEALGLPPYALYEPPSHSQQTRDLEGRQSRGAQLYPAANGPPGLGIGVHVKRCGDEAERPRPQPLNNKCGILRPTHSRPRPEQKRGSAAPSRPLRSRAAAVAAGSALLFFISQSPCPMRDTTRRASCLCSFGTRGHALYSVPRRSSLADANIALSFWEEWIRYTRIEIARG